MPITPGGTPAGGPPGGATPGGSASDFTALTEAQEKAMRSLFGLDKATKDYDKSVGSLRKTLQGMIDAKKKEIDAAKKGTDAYEKLRKELEGLEKAYDKVTDSMDKEAGVLEKASDATGKFARQLRNTLGPISESLKSHHSYNLEIQKQIELSGKWTGSQGKAHKVFADVRQQLSLTRKEGREFASVWSEGMRLGATNDELVKMTKNLRDVYGTAEGLKMMGEFIKIPASAGALKDILGGKDTAAMVRALKTATPEQAQAIASRRMTPEGKPEVAQRGARFQAAEARLEKVRDDVKAGMAWALDQGIGPEIGGMLGPISGIADDVHELVDIVKSGFNLVKTVFGGIGGLLGGGAAKAALGGAEVAAGGGGVGGAEVAAGGLGGRVGGLLAGGRVALTGANLLKGGLVAAGGQAVGMGADWLAEKAEAGGDKTAAKLARVGGTTARYAGVGGAIGSVLPGVGTAIGAGVGAAVGGTVGGVREFGDDLLKYMGVRGEAGEPGGEGDKGGGKGQGANAFVDFNRNLKTLNDQIRQVGAEIAEVPSNIESEIELSRLPTALASIDPKRMFDIGEKSATSFGATLDLATKRYSQQIDSLRAQMKNLDNQLKSGLINQEEHDEMAGQYTATLNKLTNETARAAIENAPARRAAAGAMQRLETRGGQIGTEQATARAVFQRTGAITGNIEDINKFQTTLSKGYDEILEETERAANIQHKNLTAQKTGLEAKLANGKLDKALVPVYREQLDAVNAQLEQNARVLNAKRATTQLEKQNLEIEALKEKIASAEKSLVFRRAQWARDLMKAQEEMVVQRGGTPGEIGKLARGQAAEAETQLNRFRETFDDLMASAQRQAEEARKTGNEGLRIQAEEQIYNLSKKRVELEASEQQARIHAAQAEHEQRFKELGLQTSILETVRDSAARTGQSWRVQMGYQSQLITVKRQEVEEARKAYDDAKAAGMEGAELMAKGLAVVQKESALKEAVMGKQRDFLEKAVGRSFGMGGGTKAIPNFSPRIFGPIVKDVLGGQWQGAPKTMEETRMAMGGNIRGAIAGGVPAVGQQGIGVQGRLNAAINRPGANRALGAMGALPGGQEAMAAAGGPAGVKGEEKLGVDLVVLVKSDNPIFTAQVDKITARKLKLETSRGV